MKNKCIGCGVEFQYEDSKSIGYTPKKDALYCQRCFRIQHYDDVVINLAQGIDPSSMLDKIQKMDALILWIVDLFDFEAAIIPKVWDQLQNKDIVLIVSKSDVFSSELTKEKLVSFLKSRIQAYQLKVVDVVICGHLHKPLEYNNSIEAINQSIDLHRKERDVVIMGMANVGKSTIVNGLLNDKKITASHYPGTTIDLIQLPMAEYNLYDTPGITRYDNVLTYASSKDLSQLIPKHTIKARIYQLQAGQSLSFGGIARVDFISDATNVVCYVSNDLYIHRCKASQSDQLWDKHYNGLLVPTIGQFQQFKKVKLSISQPMDIIIHGLGFISVKKPVKEIYVLVNEKIAISLRKGMI